MKVTGHYRARVRGQWQRLTAVDAVVKTHGKLRAADGRTWTIVGVGGIALDNETCLYLEEQDALPTVGEELELVVG